MCQSKAFGSCQNFKNEHWMLENKVSRNEEGGECGIRENSLERKWVQPYCQSSLK